MNALNEIVLSVCAAAVVGSFMYMLLPEGNLSKVIKTVMGIFILGCILLPALSLKNINIKSEFNTSSFDAEGLNSTYRAQLINVTQKSFENMIQTQFAAKSITVINMETNMDIDSSGCISIEGITVTADCSNIQAETIENELKNAYGISITVIPADKNSP